MSAAQTLSVHTGATVYVDGKLGTTRGIKRESGQIVGAFVQLIDHEAGTWDGEMLYVTLGKHDESSFFQWEIVEFRVIDRDEFDDLTGLAETRRALGWTR